MAKDLADTDAAFKKLRAIDIPNAVPPAFTFSPAPKKAGNGGEPLRQSVLAPKGKPLPASKDEIAYASLEDLSLWVRRGAISSTDLTQLYLDRIRALDDKLLATITLTPNLALGQAREADREIAAGRWRGPLHGIPYGAKDLLAAKGYPTTWGSPLFKDQTFGENAAVIDKLEAAGAVLVAKTSVGELAWGDVWYGGTTKNPWKLDQGSSGSSAGSASLVAAGCVGFAIGTETLGSIVSPCTQCGATGLRPTFGRVSRHGAMALAWTMDKLGPIARSAADCALVFDAIHGEDPRDPFSRAAAFAWPPAKDPKALRVGVVQELFDEDYAKYAEKPEARAALKEWQGYDARTLSMLGKIGVKLVPMKLQFSVPIGPLASILTAEAATAFDVLLRDGRVDKMVRQTADAWPNVFRQGELVPAVEYLRAMRLRTIVMREMAHIMESFDAYVVPSFGGDNLLLTNLTGHPAVVVPNGFRTGDGTPTSITFQGKLDGDDTVLALAEAYQNATGFHTKHPAL
jgi:Asp-tRNA(Asn)/Glu-tRNA(Gln) amidotransferase A subunit family amidase